MHGEEERTDNEDRKVKAFFDKYKYYFLATGIFLLVILVFAEVTIFDLVEIRRNIRIMNREQKIYQSQARADSLFLQQMNDDEFLEKYAREKFFMKREGDEIFYVEQGERVSAGSEVSE